MDFHAYISLWKCSVVVIDALFIDNITDMTAVYYYFGLPIELTAGINPFVPMATSLDIIWVT